VKDLKLSPVEQEAFNKAKGVLVALIEAAAKQEGGPINILVVPGRPDKPPAGVKQFVATSRRTARTLGIFTIMPDGSVDVA
jgi:hypothetical protein